MREALAGLRNLAQLLQSLRVAPKSVSAVLPDVYMGFSSLRRALSQLFDALRPLLVKATVLDELGSFAAPRLDLLEAELRVAMAAPVTAKSRLRLEQTVLRCCAELDSARSLLELLIEAATRPALEVSLADFMLPAFWASVLPPAAQQRTLSAKITRAASDVEFRVNPRVLTQLCAFGVELVSSSPGAGEPHIRGGVSSAGAALLLVDREASSPAEQITLGAHGLIEPTLACLEAVASLSRARLSFQPQKSRFSVEWPETCRAALEAC